VPTFRSTIDINAPATVTWRVIADFGNVYRINPLVYSSHLTSEWSQGEETTRHCDLTVIGASVEERITDWQEGISYSAVVIAKRRLPFVRNLTTTVEAELNGSRSIGSFRISYELGWWPLGALVDRLVIRPRSRRAAQLFVAGLKHFVETGEEVDAATPLDRHAAAVARG
jgi:hypothetical protein